MPDGRSIGRACENIFAHGRNWAGGSNDTSFRAGPGSPTKCKTCIRAGWAAHFLLGFAYDAAVLVTLVSLLSIPKPSHQHPTLTVYSSQPFSYGSTITTDLCQLSIWFTRCHIHIMFTAETHQLPINLITTSHVLSIVDGARKRRYEPNPSGGPFPIPKLRNMANPCQATFQVQLSSSRIIGGRRDGALFFEGQLMWWN